MTAERTILAGLIGQSALDDKLVRLFGHWLHKHYLRAQYVPLTVTQADLPDILRTLPKIGFAGVNIAAPHKVTVLTLADRVSDRAALIGTANTLVFRDDRQIYADNTEGYGFIASLRAADPGWSAGKGPAAVLGAGAAARAAVAALLDAGAREVRVANRTRARADALRMEFGAHVKVFDWVKAGNMLDEATTFVNCSALGMEGKPELRVPLDALDARCVVMDMVMTPPETRLLREARGRGCPTADGLAMFIHQAVPAFERWFGMRPEVDEATRRAVQD